MDGCTLFSAHHMRAGDLIYQTKYFFFFNQVCCKKQTGTTKIARIASVGCPKKEY